MAVNPEETDHVGGGVDQVHESELPGSTLGNLELQFMKCPAIEQLNLARQRFLAGTERIGVFN